MNNTFSTWLAYLSEHEKLLEELESCLREEKSALLANRLVLLKESSLRKEKAVRKIQDFQIQFANFIKQCASETGNSVTGIRELIAKKDRDEARVLERKRQTLARKSRTIKVLNGFNERCLNSYLGQVNLMQNVLHMVGGSPRTYTPEGYDKTNLGGRLINRSF